MSAGGRTDPGPSSVLVLLAARALPVAVPLHAPGRAPTVVTIQFDDGVADQYGRSPILSARDARDVLREHRLHRRRRAHDVGRSSPTSLQRGNEIAGHTLTHDNIKKLKRGPGPQEVCDGPEQPDRPRLPADRSFAYPFGSFDAGAEQVVATAATTAAAASPASTTGGFRRDDPAARRLRDAHAAEPEAGDDARDDRGLRDRGRAERRRLGAARLPPPLRPVRRVLDHAGDLHGAARLAPTTRTKSGTVVKTTAEVIGGSVALRRRRRCRCAAIMRCAGPRMPRSSAIARRASSSRSPAHSSSFASALIGTSCSMPWRYSARRGASRGGQACP